MRLARIFAVTWFSFALFYSSTMMPFFLDRPSRDLVGPGIFAGLFVALLVTLFEWQRARHRDRSAVN